MSEDIILTQINIYPVKSLGGITLNQSIIEERGLMYDRRWMLVDKNNFFLTQRKFSKLSLLKTRLYESHLEIYQPMFGCLSIDLKETTSKEFLVTVWDSVCLAIEVSKMANEFFSNFLEDEIKLVYMPDVSRRLVDRKYSLNNEIVGFADGFPLLLIGEASLEDLNTRLDVPVPMNRFRPNVVLRTSVPFDEDNWVEFSIGEANFVAVKPCSRCIVTTIDQSTGNKSSEPLQTLSKYRNFGNKVNFGQNLLYVGGKKQIELGDKLIVKSRKN